MEAIASSATCRAGCLFSHESQGRSAVVFCNLGLVGKCPAGHSGTAVRAAAQPANSSL